MEHDFFYGEVFCQLSNGALFLARVGLYREGFLCRFFCLVVPYQFCLVEQTDLVFAQNIGLFLTGLSETGALGVKQDLIRVIQFLFQIAFCGAQRQLVRWPTAAERR